MKGKYPTSEKTDKPDRNRAGQQRNLHLGVEPDFTPAKRAHPAFVVEDLNKILAACDRAGIATKPDTSFNGFRRVHVFDPFGNRLELMERINQ